MLSVYPNAEYVFEGLRAGAGLSADTARWVDAADTPWLCELRRRMSAAGASRLR